MDLFVSLSILIKIVNKSFFLSILELFSHYSWNIEHHRNSLLFLNSNRSFCSDILFDSLFNHSNHLQILLIYQWYSMFLFWFILSSLSQTNQLLLIYICDQSLYNNIYCWFQSDHEHSYTLSTLCFWLDPLLTVTLYYLLETKHTICHPLTLCILNTLFWNHSSINPISNPI